jgi:predicted DNA-binding transcriptional regulator AlpA
MKSQSNIATPNAQTRCTARASVSHRTLIAPLDSHGIRMNAVDLSHPDMEQRLSARQAWQFVGLCRSSFYGQMNPSDPSYDPHFPRPIPSSSTGRGPRRWKLGALIAWLQLCESNAAGV